MGRDGMAGWEKALSQPLFRLFSISLFDTANTPADSPFFVGTAKTYIRLLFDFILDSPSCPRVAPSPPRRHTKISSSIFTTSLDGLAGYGGEWVFFHVYMTLLALD